jgi:hypothetical protein
MPGVDKIVAEMRRNPASVRFAVFRTPWRGDPRVNVQDDRGAAKPYQVRQVLSAIDRWDAERGRTAAEPQRRKQ